MTSLSLYFPRGKADSNRLSRRVEKGELVRIRRGVYTDEFDPDRLPSLLQSRWHEVVKALCPAGTIAAYRTAMELRPEQGQIFLAAPIVRRKTIVVHPSLTLQLLPADTALGTEPFLPALFRSNPARQLLENLTRSRGARKTVDKALGEEIVELALTERLSRYGEDDLNRLRDEAATLAEPLNMEAAFALLNQKISALLSSHPANNVLVTPQGLAMAQKVPFDDRRLTLFSQLASYLSRCALPVEAFDNQASAWRNLSFFESYFSNYIEGTEFLIEEAEQIVFNRSEVANRHEDSHDVMAVYDLVSDQQEMMATPTSAQSLIDMIQGRHELILKQRPSKRPGKLKEKINKAGNSVFVSPENLIGTLTQSMDIYETIPPGLSRAIYIHFVLAECHPMDDGNGRLARIFMNAELAAQSLCKVIIPTVHRDSYLNGLRAATRSGQFRTMVKVIHQLQRYTASIAWLDYGEALATIKTDAADKLPDEGVATFNRKINQWYQAYPV
jgi:Fic/DOC family